MIGLDLRLAFLRLDRRDVVVGLGAGTSGAIILVAAVTLLALRVVRSDADANLIEDFGVLSVPRLLPLPGASSPHGGAQQAPSGTASAAR